MFYMLTSITTAWPLNLFLLHNKLIKVCLNRTKKTKCSFPIKGNAAESRAVALSEPLVNGCLWNEVWTVLWSLNPVLRGLQLTSAKQKHEQRAAGYIPNYTSAESAGKQSHTQGTRRVWECSVLPERLLVAITSPVSRHVWNLRVSHSRP